MRLQRMAWMTVLLVALGGAAACSGDDDDDGVDAGGGTPDAAAGVAPTCTEYCTRVTTNCSGLNIQYTDMAECMSYCGAIAWTPGVDDPAQDGDTLGCRQYHAGAAGSTGMPDVHCPHAGPTGANVCGTACDVYCDNLEKNCAADSATSTATTSRRTAPRTPSSTPTGRPAPPPAPG